MAAVALANGLNANMLRKWVHEADRREVSVPIRAERAPALAAVSGFVPLSPPVAAAKDRIFAILTFQSRTLADGAPYSVNGFFPGPEARLSNLALAPAGARSEHTGRVLYNTAQDGFNVDAAVQVSHVRITHRTTSVSSGDHDPTQALNERYGCGASDLPNP